MWQMPLQVYLFGWPRIERDNQPLRISRNKSMALIAYLAINAQPIGREVLAALFYPESDSALAYLRRDLSELRKILGQDALSTNGEVDLVTHDNSLWVDVAAFREALELVASHNHFPDRPCTECLVALESAVNLYTDNFLAGFNLTDCSQFDEWRFFQAESLRQSLDQALQKLIRWYESQGQWRPAIENSRRWLSLDPLHEPAQRRVMELYAKSGQWTAALRQYELSVRQLEAELGVAPEEETVALYEAIRSRQIDKGVKVEPISASDFMGNLPAYATSFIGREVEMEEIIEMVGGDDCRLLTLVGPGGIGKTRSAIEAARRMSFPDGIWFVPLAPLSDAMSLPTTIANTLKLHLYGQNNLKLALLNQLEQKELLLLLDNFEHLLASGGAEFVSGLLEHAPGVKVLVTSRQKLDLIAEWVFPLSGLEVPAGEGNGELESFGAVRLFLQRARQAKHDFSRGPETDAAVARICQLVAGMPLALELAATWTPTLAPAEIADEIQRNLDFLSTGARDLLDRHRSIRAVFNTSWELLADQERQVFRQLSIFRGGFDRAAAEAVCQLPTGEDSILPVLSSLVGKSFLESGDAGRYQVHELMRQFGAARLMQDPAVERVAREQHCRHYLSLCAEQEGRLKGPDQQKALQLLATDLENIRLGWAYAAENGFSKLILGAVEAVWLLIHQSIYSNFQEHAAFYDPAISRLEKKVRTDESTEDVDELALAKLQAFQASFYTRLGEIDQSITLLERSLTHLRRLGASREIALALNFLAVSVHLQGDYERERVILDESIALAEDVGDRWLAGYSLNDLGMVNHLLGNTEKAQGLSRESLAIFRTLGDRRGLGYVLDNLGLFAFHLGNYAEAEQLYRECLSIRGAASDKWGEAVVLIHLAAIDQAQGDAAKARSRLLEALRAARKVGTKPLLLDILVRLAVLLADGGQDAQARRIIASSLNHPLLSETARLQAGRLVDTWEERQSMDLGLEAPETLDVLVGDLLAEAVS